MTIERRPETSADEPFLHDLIVSGIAQELGADTWPPALRDAVLGQQCRVRRQAARVGGPGRTSEIILLDGAPVGWICLADLASEVRVVDILIAPDRQGKGVGAAVFRSVLDAAVGRPVRLAVNVTNPRALRFYERLGFRRIGGDEVQHQMEHV
jgi:GNAT superfamily N-acetyltransferase